MCDECGSYVDVRDMARERIYGFLAAILTSPDAGAWGRVTAPEEQERDLASMDALRAAGRGDRAEEGESGPWTASTDLRALMVELCQPFARLRADYERFFTASRRISHSPLELEHQSRGRRRRPERGLEELRRSYDEAGHPDREGEPRRADHAARELDFMAWLVGRSRFERRLACLGASTRESLRTCDLAQRQFFGHHLAGWLPDLAAQMEGYAGGGFLEQLGRFLAAWITLERQYLDADPRFAGEIDPPRAERAPRRSRRKGAVVAAP